MLAGQYDIVVVRLTFGVYENLLEMSILILKKLLIISYFLYNISSLF